MPSTVARLRAASASDCCVMRVFTVQTIIPSRSTMMLTTGMSTFALKLTSTLFRNFSMALTASAGCGCPT